MIHRWRKWKSGISRLLVGTILVQASLLNMILSPISADAAETPVVLNEISPSGNWVELYATRDVNFDAERWTVLADNGLSVTLTGSMATGQLRVVDLANGSLNGSSGWVKLTEGTGDADRVTWGTGFGSQLPAVTAPNTFARTKDGAGWWVANVTATKGSSNVAQISTIPPVPSVVEVAAGSTNPVNQINGQTASNTSVRGSYAGTAKLVATLVDTTNRATDPTSAVGSSLDAGQVNGIDARTLLDGPITVRAYTETNGIRSAWATATATKDTIVPAVPTNPMVRAGSRNGPNVINSANVKDVRVGAAVGSDTSRFDVTLEDTSRQDIVATVSADGSQGIDASSLSDGGITLTLVAKDAAGNASVAVSTSAVGKDTAAPAAPLNLTARNASGYVVLSWTASPAGDLGSYRVYGDRSSGSIDWSTPLGEVLAGTATFTTPLMPNGLNHFAVRAVDRVGNEELVGATAEVTVAGALNQAALTGGNRSLNLIDPLRLWLQVSPNTAGTAQVQVINDSTVNPTATGLPSGHAAVGKYFELTMNNQSAFPFEIRIYYTTVDLKAAGVSDDRQLEGIRFYDATKKSWELYSKTGVNTADVSIGNLDFAGYVWANADHLTPIVASADIAPPDKPADLIATSGDGLVKLNWTRMSGTASYFIRYREGTNKDTATYRTLSVSGGDFTHATISGLQNGVLYEFGVASVDWVSNESAFSVVEQTPTAASSHADFVLPSSTTSVQTSGTSAPAPSSGTILGGNAVGGSPEGAGTGGHSQGATGGGVGGTQSGNNDQTGQIKGGTNEQRQAASTRTLVTILIIVIAAAAGFGGYYGYQWWMTKPEASVSDSSPAPTPEPKKKPTRPERSGRW